MRFRIGNKVKIKKEYLKEIIRHRSFGKMKNYGIVTTEGSTYIKIRFQSPDRAWWIKPSNLELIPTNQQLLFDFMS